MTLLLVPIALICGIFIGRIRREKPTESRRASDGFIDRELLNFLSYDGTEQE